MESKKTSDLLALWDVTRRTAELLDKSINDNRKIFLTLTIALATVAAAMIDKVENSSPNTVLMTFATGIVGLSMIFWGIELHKDQYLRIVGATGQNIEKKMGVAQKKMGITTELYFYRERLTYEMGYEYWLIHRFSADNFAYLLYPGVASAAIVTASIINVNEGVFFHFEYVAWTVGLALIVEICLLMLYTNRKLFFIYCGSRYDRRGNDGAEHLKELIDNCRYYGWLSIITLAITDIFLVACIASPFLRVSTIFLAFISAIAAKYVVAQYCKNSLIIRYVYSSKNENLTTLS